jgi:predicted TIM-barrel fold metal-dependent hydrolase
MIDFHLHIGNMFRPHYPRLQPMSVHQLIDKMDREGIQMGVLLPLESPEGNWGYFLTEEAAAARDLFPERLIAFCCADPRYPEATQLIDYAVNHLGCKGFGEHINGLAFDDPLNRRLYAKCDEYGLPLVLDMTVGLCWDTVGLPRLEACLKDYRNVTFVGHGPRFWAAISGDDTDDENAPLYPKGPVTPGGAVDRLLSEYDNLWVDLSAGSGYNAMTRDPEYTAGFVQRHWRKLLFGTDYLGAFQGMPIIKWLRELKVEEEVREAIAAGNARRLLGLS